MFLFLQIYSRGFNFCNLLGKRQMQRSIMCKPTDNRVYIVEEKIDYLLHLFHFPNKIL